MINILSLVLTLTIAVQGPPVTIDDNNTEATTVIRLFELKGAWSDQPDAAPGLDITSLLMGNMGSQRSFPDLLKALESAIADEEIDVIALDLSGGRKSRAPSPPRSSSLPPSLSLPPSQLAS